jgi:hypothetical protein
MDIIIDHEFIKLKQMKRIVTIIAVVLPFFIFTACEKDNGTNGTLNLSITDSPIDTDGVSGVFITVSEIQYHISGNNWKKFEDYDGPRSFNLLDLQRGESELLGSFKMEAGTHTQIRFILDAPVIGTGQHSNPGCYLEFEDGSTKNLYVSSGSQTGYKTVGSFTVPINGSVDVTADFDVRKSVVESGITGMYILKPTIRLVVENQAGQIAGSVSGVPANSQVIVYTYETGIYNNTEANDPTEEKTRFPNAVSSDMVDETGAYYLAYLASGVYDLVITAISGGESVAVLGVIENIHVESRKTTSVNIDISEF